MLQKMEVQTKKREELVDVTGHIRQIVTRSGVIEGTATLFVPHTTAAVTINENADPTVPLDIIRSLQNISPVLPEFRHLEGNSDAHVKSSLIGSSQQVIISGGQLVLGTWQGIFFCEFDGPRLRKMYVKVCEC